MAVCCSLLCLRLAQHKMTNTGSYKEEKGTRVVVVGAEPLNRCHGEASISSALPGNCEALLKLKPTWLLSACRAATACYFPRGFS